MTPDSAPQPSIDNHQHMLAFLCDHLVALAGTYVALDEDGRDQGEERFFALPGFMMTVRGVWCLVTAGHAIQELEDGLADGEYRLTNCCLAAHFGSKGQTGMSIPFDPTMSGRHSINDEEAGLDFALLTLYEEQRVALKENGIRPISEQNCSRQNIAACEVFALLGLPTCLDGECTRVVPHGNGIAGVVHPALVPLQKTQLPPDEMLPSTYSWFVGRVGAAQGLPDIDGMSGGPIFGFFRDADGQWRYWIVAMQSRWDRDSRIILACPVPVIARLVEEGIQRHAEAGHGSDGAGGE